MPQINLTALTGRQLRQRLDSSRARGDAALAYEILREMAARRESGRGRRAAEPRLISIDLGDPQESPDLPPMPAWPAAPEDTAPEAEPPVPPPETAADALDLPPPPPSAAPDDLDLRLAPRDPPPRPARRLPLAASFALSIGVGLALGWTGARLVQAPPSWVAVARPVARAEPPPPAPAAPRIEPLAPPPAEAPVLTEAPVLDAAEPAEAPAPAAPEVPAVAQADPCAAEPTAADRRICGDPRLRDLQRDLRRAYAEALDAHQDRARLRQRQLAWRDARSEVSDPDRLARLYEQRIVRLRSATADARARR